MKTTIKTIELIYRYMKIKGIGVVQTNKLLLSIGNDIEHIERHIISSLNDSQVKDFNNHSITIENIKSTHQINFISLLDCNYPNELKLCLSTNTPPVISYIGNINLLQKKKVGVSGSRNVSNKGIAITKDCVEQLSKDDICIVSGYASGVDYVAHHTALEQGASTIIVLPEGIENFRIRKELQDYWDWNRILVISEFMPNDNWSTGRAMSRNNTIIGLSDVVIVVEARETGGSFDTGIRTIKKGKSLFVPQYSIIPDSASGNNMLINQGASPIRMSVQTGKANLSSLFELLSFKNKYSLF